MEELDAINVPRDKLWARAMLFACHVTNKSVTTSSEEGELLFGTAPTPDYLRSFGSEDKKKCGEAGH